MSLSRDEGVKLTVSFLSAIAITLAAAPYAKGFRSKGKFDGGDIVVMCLLFGWYPAAGMVWLCRKIFVGFEVFDRGSGPRSIRYLQLAGAALFQLSIAFVFWVLG